MTGAKLDAIHTPATAAAPCSQGDLWAALAIAQSRAKAVGHDKRNTHHRYNYASAEAVLTAATEAMAGTGMGLVPTGYQLDGDLLTRSYLLTHESGQTHRISQVWPLTSRKGSERDKALAGALTSSLAYMLRDLLLMPRVEPGTDSLHDERPGPIAGVVAAGPAPKTPDRATAAPWVEGQHHSSFTRAEQRAFFAALGEATSVPYKEIADALEAEGKGRPSWWPPEWRARFLDRLKAGPPMTILDKLNGSGAK